MSVVFAGYEIQEGTPVIARDGTEIGTVIGEDGGKLLVDVYDVERHLLLPAEAVSAFDDDFIMIDLTTDWVRSGDWGTEVKTVDTARADRLATDDGKTVIDIHEEDLTAAKREIAKGLVTIRKRIVLDDESIDVDLSEERVNVVRVALDRDADADYAFEEGVVEIELKGETVDLGRKVRVTGQVEVDKERVGRTETYTAQTRREEIDVEEVDYVDGDVDVKAKKKS